MLTPHDLPGLVAHELVCAPAATLRTPPPAGHRCGDLVAGAVFITMFVKTQIVGRGLNLCC